MSKSISNKIPFKHLVRDSGRLFMFFMLGTVLITSLHDISFQALVQRGTVFSTLFIGIFIINTFLLYHFDKTRKSASQRIWKKTFLIGYCCSAVYYLLHYSVISWLESRGYITIAFKRPELHGWRLYIFMMYGSLVVYSFIFLIQNSVLHQFEKSRIQVELLQLKAANAEAVNQLLRQQIQPHFLFNALNILKSLIKRDTHRAENYLLHLSDFLRLSISKNTSGVATIAEELTIANDYMEMQRIRFGDALQYKVEITVEDDCLKQKLPFFSLQPLVENAIKHNELTIENPLYIKIEREGEMIVVSNNIQEKKQMEASTGTGLTMLKKRYNILNETPPSIKNDGYLFEVKMKIIK